MTRKKRQPESYIGEVYGKWTVVKVLPLNKETGSGDRKLVCRCECGVVGEVYVSNLTRGGSKSCRACWRPKKNRGNAAWQELGRMRREA